MHASGHCITPWKRLLEKKAYDAAIGLVSVKLQDTARLEESTQSVTRIRQGSRHKHISHKIHKPAIIIMQK
jgi:hypothetical protein